MTDFQNIKFETKNHIAYITIDRPKVLNALNMATMQELKQAFAAAKDDADVRVVILTGAGEKAFVAGADIGELSQHTPVSAKEYTHHGQAIIDAIENLGKPVIACINGFALGGGCELAMACTMRLASDNAKLGQPEVKLGLIPGYGGTQRLSRLVGKGIAMQLVLTGEMIIGAGSASHRPGERSRAAAELIPRAEAIAAKIIANAPLAIQYCMEAVNHGLDHDRWPTACSSKQRCSASAAPPKTRTKARRRFWRSGQRSLKESKQLSVLGCRFLVVSSKLVPQVRVLLLDANLGEVKATMEIRISVLLCRFVIFALMLVIWRLSYVNARSINGMPTGKKKITLRIGTTFAQSAYLVLHVTYMERFAPDDAYGNSFFLFVLVEAGGAIGMMFYVLLRDRARAKDR